MTYSAAANERRRRRWQTYFARLTDTAEKIISRRLFRAHRGTSSRELFANVNFFSSLKIKPVSSHCHLLYLPFIANSTATPSVLTELFPRIRIASLRRRSMIPPLLITRENVSRTRVCVYVTALVRFGRSEKSDSWTGRGVVWSSRFVRSVRHAFFRDKLWR